MVGACDGVRGREARRFLRLAAANLQLMQGEDCFVELRLSSSIDQRLFFVGVGGLVLKVLIDARWYGWCGSVIFTVRTVLSFYAMFVGEGWGG